MTGATRIFHIMGDERFCLFLKCGKREGNHEGGSGGIWLQRYLLHFDSIGMPVVSFTAMGWQWDYELIDSSGYMLISEEGRIKILPGGRWIFILPPIILPKRQLLLLQ